MVTMGGHHCLSFSFSVGQYSPPVWTFKSSSGVLGFLSFFFLMIPRLAFYFFDFRHEKKIWREKFRTGGVYFRVIRQGGVPGSSPLSFISWTIPGSTGVVMG